MTATRDYLALDLGATSGRAVLGAFDGGKVALREVHRFAHDPVSRAGNLFWNWPHLQREIETGLIASAAASKAIVSLGCDSWGLDHGFLNKDGVLLEWPYCYQDTRTASALGNIERLVPRQELFARTAAPVIDISTLGQLLATARARPVLLERAETMLFIPGLVHHQLTGLAVTEHCGACVSELWAWRKREWDRELMQHLALPARILPELRETGSQLGTISPSVQRKLDVPAWPVHLPAGHDTALAAFAAPAGPDDLVISLGTWAMLGLAVPQPITSPEALQAGAGTYAIPGAGWMFMTGMLGLGLLERLRKELALPPPAELTALAAAAPSLRVCLDPMDARFTKPGRLADALQVWFHQAGAPYPEDPGILVRSLLEGLALCIARTAQELEVLAGKTLRNIAIVGGGVRNRLLLQLIANASGHAVAAGAPEATALGNVLVQALGRGDLASADDARRVAWQSSPVQWIEPEDQAMWTERRAAFRPLKKGAHV